MQPVGLSAEAAIRSSALHALDCSSQLRKLLMPRMLLHRGIECCCLLRTQLQRATLLPQRCCLELLLHAVLLQEGRYGDEVVELLLSFIGASKRIWRGCSCRGCGCRLWHRLECSAALREPWWRNGQDVRV